MSFAFLSSIGSGIAGYLAIRKAEGFVENQVGQARDLIADVHARSVQVIDRRADEVQRLVGVEVSKLNETVRHVGTQVVSLGVAVVSAGVLIFSSGSEEYERESIAPSIGRFALIGIVAGTAINAFGTQLRSIGSHALDAVQTLRHNWQRPKRKGAAISRIREPRMDLANPCDPRCVELMKAALNGDCEKIKHLQKEGVYLEAKDATGKTALHWAAIGNQKKAIEWLWYYGCSLKELDQDNHLAPLHYVTDPDLYRHCEKLTHAKNRFSFHAPIYLFYPPENLVFRGGGAKGTAHLGAYRFLVEHGLLRDLRRVAGTSAGAITALLVGLGHETDFLERILLQIDFMDFLDHPLQQAQKAAASLAKGANMTIEDACNLIQSAINGADGWATSGLKEQVIGALWESFEEGGACLGEKLLKWIEKHIKDKTGIDNCTFKEYRNILDSKGFKHVYFYATKIEPEIVPVCFNSEDPQFDDLVIADVVRASGAFPFVFRPQTLRTKKIAGTSPTKAPEFGIFIDGGLIMNFPMRVFDCLRFSALNPPRQGPCVNYQTLGFNLVDPPVQTKTQKRPNIVDVAVSLKDTWMEAETLLAEAAKDYRGRVVHTDSLGVGAILGCLGPEENKTKLIQSGRRATRTLFLEQERFAEENENHNPACILSIFEGENLRQRVNRAPRYDDELKQPEYPIPRRGSEGQDSNHKNDLEMRFNQPHITNTVPQQTSSSQAPKRRTQADALKSVQTHLNKRK